MMLRLIVLSAAVLLTACSADKGDTCQVKSDCGSGLICCKLSTSFDERGTCESVCDLTTDAGDDGGEDASTDAATDMPTDANMSLPDAASDASQSDAN